MPMRDVNDMKRNLEHLDKGAKNMPLQKGRSKDLPGKTGFSENDRSKLMDVVRNPGKYDVDVSDQGTNGGDEKDGCEKELFQFIFLAITAISLFKHFI